MLAELLFREASPFRTIHPNAPRERAKFLIAQRMASYFERQLDLAMMVALVPDHVLQHQNGMVVVNFHLPA
jgi:hypothetical protein